MFLEKPWRDLHQYELSEVPCWKKHTSGLVNALRGDLSQPASRCGGRLQDALGIKFIVGKVVSEDVRYSVQPRVSVQLCGKGEEIAVNLCCICRERRRLGHHS